MTIFYFRKNNFNTLKHKILYWPIIITTIKPNMSTDFEWIGIIELSRKESDLKFCAVTQ